MRTKDPTGTITTMRKRAIATILVALSLASVACASRDTASGNAREAGQRSNGAGVDGGSDSAGAGPATAGAKADPRDDGLMVALGEWAVTLEAGAIRPGRVTFVVRNRGSIPHGFEIEAEGESEGDSSGSGSGDGLKAETELLQPGETARLALDLHPGLYKVECLVDGHDDLGMEGFLEVRTDAPLVRDRMAGRDRRGRLRRRGRYRNRGLHLRARRSRGGSGHRGHVDERRSGTAHGDGRGWFVRLRNARTGTDVLGLGAGNGPVTYRCEIHPDMVGTLTVR